MKDGEGGSLALSRSIFSQWCQHGAQCRQSRRTCAPHRSSHSRSGLARASPPSWCIRSCSPVCVVCSKSNLFSLIYANQSFSNVALSLFCGQRPQHNIFMNVNISGNLLKNLFKHRFGGAPYWAEPRCSVEIFQNFLTMVGKCVTAGKPKIKSFINRTSSRHPSHSCAL